MTFADSYTRVYILNFTLLQDHSLKWNLSYSQFMFSKDAYSTKYHNKAQVIEENLTGFVYEKATN